MRECRNNRIALRIGIAPLLSIVYFPLIIDEMKKAYPDISIRLLNMAQIKHMLSYSTMSLI